VRVSLIVCTRNRGSRLPDFLKHIAALDFPSDEWELIIVDHASDDDTSSLIKSFAAQAPFRVRPLWTDVQGLCAAKNVALSCADGEIIALTDDDCYVRPDYLRAIDEVFQDPNIGIAGGRVKRHDPNDAAISEKDVDTPTDIAPFTLVTPGVIHGANLAVRRQVVDAIGGFDPLFGPGAPCAAGEDIEYVARAVWAGWRARYDPRPIVEHHHRRKPGSTTEMYRNTYDRGRGAYYAKYSLRRESRHLYLRWWFRAVQRRGPGRRRFLREFMGGIAYLFRLMFRPVPIPTFAQPSHDSAARTS
jgi:glycosyltransferase involved in cell wall biosynthesis